MVELKKSFLYTVIFVIEFDFENSEIKEINEKYI